MDFMKPFQHDVFTCQKEVSECSFCTIYTVNSLRESTCYGYRDSLPKLIREIKEIKEERNLKRGTTQYSTSTQSKIANTILGYTTKNIAEMASISLVSDAFRPKKEDESIDEWYSTIIKEIEKIKTELIVLRNELLVAKEVSI